MTVAHTGNVFSAVARHFDNPRAAEAVRLTVLREGAAPVLLTPVQAWEALYGPAHDPALVTPIWQTVLRAAEAEHGPTETWRLLLIWLAQPRLTGTALRICRRLRADRADVEAEMVLSLLEGLQGHEPASARSVDDLLRAVRSRAWRLARAGVREIASAAVEHLADDRAVPVDEPQDTDRVRPVQVEVTRHERADGLRAHLRFTVSPESVGRRALIALTETAGRPGAVCRTQDTDRRPVTNSSPHRGSGRR